MTERKGRTAIRHENQSHVRRLASAMATIVAFLFLSSAPALGASQLSVAESTATRAAELSSFEASILERINAVRRDHGLKALRLAGGLGRSATSHARTLATKGIFAHQVDGISPSTRIRRFYPGSVVGEVLQWRSPTLTPAQAVSAWLGSPAHRSIILGVRYSEIGLAAQAVSKAPGYYGGRPVTIVVADLGAR